MPSTFTTRAIEVTTVFAILIALLALSSGASAQRPPRDVGAGEELARRLAAAEARLADWAGLARYREANAELGGPLADERRVVFYGNSITDSWAEFFPAHFPGKPYVGRGISGQTTPQLLVRFRQDVIDLNPAVVVILAGTNDIAGNTGPSTLDMIADNLRSMVELAEANGIVVVLCSVLPALDYPWRPGVQPAAKIVALNSWIKTYAAERGVVFVDYWSAMADAQQGLRSDLTTDGVHPNEAGYRVMAALVEPAIEEALRPTHAQQAPVRRGRDSGSERGRREAAHLEQQAPVTIRAGVLLDGRGGVSRNVDIVVDGARISAIRPASSEQPTWDYSDYTVMPGGIDTHVHINWHFDPDGRTHHLPPSEESPEQALRYALENAEATLRSGVTTVQSLGARIDAEVQRAIAEGRAVGPRVLTSLGSISDRDATPEQLRTAVRRAVDSGADVIKIFASASIRDGGAATLSLEQLQAACGEARRLNRRSVVHAHGPESAIRAAQAGCTTVEHGALLDDAALDTLEARGTFYDPNIGLVLQNYLENRERFLGIGNYTEEGFAHMQRAVPLALDAFKRALRRPKLRIVFGTDAVAGAHGRNFEELIHRVEQGGQPATDAIVSATSLAALSLGMQDSIGTLAPGMIADLIAVRGNPAEDIRALRSVVFVMKNGRAVHTPPGAPQPGDDWPAYGGDAGSMKYSPLAQIHRDNVHELQPAWEWHTGERSITETDSTKAADPGDFQVTPLVIGDTMLLSTPFNRVVALDATSGELLWTHDPGAYREGQPSNGTGFVHRGVATWSDGEQRRIFMNSRWRLIALDARNGRPIATFGEHGEVDLTKTLRRPVRRTHYTNTSPPVVWRDLVIVGNGVGDRLVYPGDPPGDVQAFDVRTGTLVWRFNTVPDSGEFGIDSWEDGSWKRVGHTNVWAPFSVDFDRGIVYLPVSTPSNDFYGGGRKGDNLFAESLVAVDARTGRRLWHFQTVHHGLWDYDIPAPPVLYTATVDGRRIDAVAVLGKTGFVYAFDRVSGKPIWPIEERPVPASDVPGERAALMQPFPTRPKPITRQGFSEDDLIDFTPEIRRAALAEMKLWRSGPLFTPPSVQGTIMQPGVIGGVGWGGGAYDPVSQTLFVKGTNQPALIRLVQLPKSDTIDAVYSFDRSARLRVRLTAPDAQPFPDLPLGKPPYGNLTAIDMRTGEHRWQVTLGDAPAVRDHPLLRDLNLPPLGVAGAPGPIVTAGGLLFVTGGGNVLYALDAESGTVLWEADLGGRAYAVPMTYRSRNGRQYVAIAVGGGEHAVLKAFVLPEAR